MKKMELGKLEHEQEKRRDRRRRALYGIDKEEIRRVWHDVMVEDPELGLYGRVDTALELNSGEWVPVEVKYSDLGFVTRAWRKQMLAYACLLERTKGVKVRRALFYFLPSKRAVWINLQAEEKAELEKDVERMRQVASSDSIPPPVDISRCKYCEMFKYCQRL